LPKARGRIEFRPQGVKAPADPRLNLLEISRNAGIGLENKCGGVGKCGKCRLQVTKGRLTPATTAEKKLLTEAERAAGYRLACQARPRDAKSAVDMQVPALSLTLKQRFQVEGLAYRGRPDPPVRAYEVKLKPPAIKDVRSDLARLKDALETREGVSLKQASLAALAPMPDVLRDNGWKADLLVRGEELLAVRAPGAGRVHGLAVDLGTSKVALFLVDMASGETLAELGCMNPQLPWGEDVMSRIQYANTGAGEARELQELVGRGIGVELEQMLEAHGLVPSDIVETCLVGNTAMHHLFAGLPVRQLGFAPYVPATTSAVEVTAAELDLAVLPQGRVYLPSPIAGFVGSDMLAAIMATRLHRQKGPVLLMDLGTNTELALKVDGRIVCCSCASGPAFEGGALRHGMRAAPGAIEKVRVGTGGEILVSTVENAPARGICGSGILDSLAALKNVEVITPAGRMSRDRPDVSEENGELAFRLAPFDDGDGWVTITQNDVREVQKAKGAVRAGIEMLMHHAGIEPSDLRRVIIAGAFGNYIDPLSALSIALIPPVPPRRIRQVGNAAGVGARALLCSSSLRREAERLAGRIEYLELVAYPKSELYFASAMMLSEDAVEAYMRKWQKRR